MLLHVSTMVKGENITNLKPGWSCRPCVLFVIIFVCLVCGLKTEGKRVVGGESASVNEYPWMAGLYEEGKQFPSCGGALINSR